MRIAYWTLDPVNEHDARRMADDCDVTLQPVYPRDLPVEGPFGGEIYDLDSWPAAEREQLLVRLLHEPLSWPVAVHSYGLDQHETRALRHRGILVRRRLGLGLMLMLCRAATADAAEQRAG